MTDGPGHLAWSARTAGPDRRRRCGRNRSLMPNSGRWLSGWSCRGTHDYSQHWDTAVGRGDPALSIVASDQSAPNADYAQPAEFTVEMGIGYRSATHGGTFCQGAWWAGPVTCGGRRAGWTVSWLSSQVPGFVPPRGPGVKLERPQR